MMEHEGGLKIIIKAKIQEKPEIRVHKILILIEKCKKFDDKLFGCIHSAEKEHVSLQLIAANRIASHLCEKIYGLLHNNAYDISCGLTYLSYDRVRRKPCTFNKNLFREIKTLTSSTIEI